jgi:threonine dehydratase
MAVSYEMIVEARERIRSSIYPASLMETVSISSLTGLNVKLQGENLQKTGSFKIRGATNKIALLNPQEKAKGVVAASAGNHAQGVAYASEQAGVMATVVMPRLTSLAKLEAMSHYPAAIVLEGQTYDEAADHAHAIQRETGATFVHPFDDADVIAGQGTIAIDIVEQWPEVDTIIAAIGGGGLISGIATAAKEMNPAIRIIGVQASGAASAQLALKEGKPAKLKAVNTLADGIAVKQIGEITFPIIQRLVDEVVTVDEDEIAAAVLLLLEKSKMVVEGAGAAPLAALMYRKGMVKGKNVALVLSGGNMDVNIIGKIIDSGLAKSGRFMTTEVMLNDEPGSLHRLLGTVAELEANVLSVEHNRTSAKAPFGQTLVTLYLETRGYDHIERITRKLSESHDVQSEP